MRRQRHIPFIVLVLLSFAAIGCEREHEATDTVHSALQALQYGDADGLLDRHIVGTGEGMYCASETFPKILDKARAARSPDECERLRGVSNRDAEKLPDEVRLVVQVARFLCEHPDADCRDYGRQVFRSQLEQTGLLDGVTRWEVKRVLGDASRAVAYVDLHLEDGVEHRALRLRKQGNRWYVSSGIIATDEREGSR